MQIKGNDGQYMLVDRGSEKILKRLDRHVLEESLGRPLKIDERPSVDTGGNVVLAKAHLPYPVDEPCVRDVKGEMGKYFMVSTDGQLISKRSNKIVRQNSINGYPGHVTKIGGREGKHAVLKTHRCVAEAFIDNPENKPTVNHKDGNKWNPTFGNLEWATLSENTQHAYATDLIPKSDYRTRPNRKLSKEEVDSIRAEIGFEEKSLRRIARENNVDRKTITGIRDHLYYMEV